MQCFLDWFDAKVCSILEWCLITFIEISNDWFHCRTHPLLYVITVKVIKFVITKDPFWEEAINKNSKIRIVAITSNGNTSYIFNEVPLLAILTRNISSNFFPWVLVNMWVQFLRKNCLLWPLKNWHFVGVCSEKMIDRQQSEKSIFKL